MKLIVRLNCFACWVSARIMFLGQASIARASTWMGLICLQMSAVVLPVVAARLRVLTATRVAAVDVEYNFHFNLFTVFPVYVNHHSTRIVANTRVVLHRISAKHFVSIITERRAKARRSRSRSQCRCRCRCR